jgi:hypothetical protein
MTQVEETGLDNSAINDSLIQFSVYLPSRSTAQKAIMKQARSQRRMKQTYRHKQVTKRSNIHQSYNNSLINAITLIMMQ